MWAASGRGLYLTSSGSRVIGRNVDFSADVLPRAQSYGVQYPLSPDRIRFFSAGADSGGRWEYTNPRKSADISLYSFPLFALIALLIKLFAKIAFPVIDGCIGFFLLFHLHSRVYGSACDGADLGSTAMCVLLCDDLLLNIALLFWM